MPPKEKEAYQKETEIKLKKIKTRITTLEKRAKKAEADIEVRYDQKMGQIRGQYAQTKEKLEELRESNLDEWLELKTGMEQALNALSEAVEVVPRHISAESEE